MNKIIIYFHAPYVKFGRTVFVDSKPIAVIRKLRTSTWKLGSFRPGCSMLLDEI